MHSRFGRYLNLYSDHSSIFKSRNTPTRNSNNMMRHHVTFYRARITEKQHTLIIYLSQYVYFIPTFSPHTKYNFLVYHYTRAQLHSPYVPCYAQSCITHLLILRIYLLISRACHPHFNARNASILTRNSIIRMWNDANTAALCRTRIVTKHSTHTNSACVPFMSNRTRARPSSNVQHAKHSLKAESKSRITEKQHILIIPHYVYFIPTFSPHTKYNSLVYHYTRAQLHSPYMPCYAQSRINDLLILRIYLLICRACHPHLNARNASVLVRNSINRMRSDANTAALCRARIAAKHSTHTNSACVPLASNRERAKPSSNVQHAKRALKAESKSSVSVSRQHEKRASSATQSRTCAQGREEARAQSAARSGTCARRWETEEDRCRIEQISRRSFRTSNNATRENASARRSADSFMLTKSETATAAGEAACVS